MKKNTPVNLTLAHFARSLYCAAAARRRIAHGPAIAIVANEIVEPSSRHAHCGGEKGSNESRKNRKICFCPFSNCNRLPSNMFQTKVQTGILRIIRNFLRVGIWGVEKL